jgi:hypothetical protein
MPLRIMPNPSGFSPSSRFAFTSLRQRIVAGNALDKAINGVRRKWSAALAGEHIAAVGELPTQLAQRSYLIAPQRLNRSFPILGSTHMQGS